MPRQMTGALRSGYPAAMDKHPADTPERDWPTLHPQDDPDAMRPDLGEDDDKDDEVSREGHSPPGSDDTSSAT
jgi:hypothetical protein